MGVSLVEPFIRDDGRVDVRPVQVHAGGIVWYGDYVHVAGTSRGEPDELRERRRVLPVGPEDVAYWPQRDELWSVSEYPGARYVFAMSRTRLLAHTG